MRSHEALPRKHLPSLRARATIACLAGLVVTLVVGVGQAVHEIRDLDSRRDQALESEWESRA